MDNNLRRRVPSSASSSSSSLVPSSIATNSDWSHRSPVATASASFKLPRFRFGSSHSFASSSDAPHSEPRKTSALFTRLILIFVLVVLLYVLLIKPFAVEWERSRVDNEGGTAVFSQQAAWYPVNRTAKEYFNPTSRAAAVDEFIADHVAAVVVQRGVFLSHNLVLSLALAPKHLPLQVVFVLSAAATNALGGQTDAIDDKRRKVRFDSVLRKLLLSLAKTGKTVHSSLSSIDKYTVLFSSSASLSSSSSSSSQSVESLSQMYHRGLDVISPSAGTVLFLSDAAAPLDPATFVFNLVTEFSSVRAPPSFPNSSDHEVVPLASAIGCTLVESSRCVTDDDATAEALAHAVTDKKLWTDPDVLVADAGWQVGVGTPRLKRRATNKKTSARGSKESAGQQEEEEPFRFSSDPLEGVSFFGPRSGSSLRAAGFHPSVADDDDDGEYEDDFDRMPFLVDAIGSNCMIVDRIALHEAGAFSSTASFVSDVDAFAAGAGDDSAMTSFLIARLMSLDAARLLKRYAVHLPGEFIQNPLGGRESDRAVENLDQSGVGGITSLRRSLSKHRKLIDSFLRQSAGSGVSTDSARGQHVERATVRCHGLIAADAASDTRIMENASHLQRLASTAAKRDSIISCLRSILPSWRAAAAAAPQQSPLSSTTMPDAAPGWLLSLRIRGLHVSHEDRSAMARLQNRVAASRTALAVFVLPQRRRVATSLLKSLIISHVAVSSARLLDIMPQQEPEQPALFPRNVVAFTRSLFPEYSRVAAAHHRDPHWQQLAQLAWEAPKRASPSAGTAVASRHEDKWLGQDVIRRPFLRVFWYADVPRCSCSGLLNEIAHFVRTLSQFYVVSLIAGTSARTAAVSDCFCPGLPFADTIERSLMSNSQDNIEFYPKEIKVWISSQDPVNLFLEARNFFTSRRMPDILILRCMYEFTRPSMDWEAVVAKYSGRIVGSGAGIDALWVPSQSVKQMLLDSGSVVDKGRLFVVPEGTDTSFYSPHAHEPLSVEELMARSSAHLHWCNRPTVPIRGGSRSSSRKFTFLSQFKWEPRKGWDILLEAYFDAFGNGADDGDVTLVLLTNMFFTRAKGHAAGDDPANIELAVADVMLLLDELRLRKSADDPRSSSSGRGWGRNRRRLPQTSGSLSHAQLPRFCIITEPLSENDVARILRGADAFVLPTRGEGWGLPTMQAMSMALPVISTNWGGSVDFTTPDTTFLIELDRLEEIPKDSVYEHRPGKKWATPSVSHLGKLMRYVYEEPEHAKEVGRRAREHIVKNFDDDVVFAKHVDPLLQHVAFQTRNVKY